MKTILTLCCLLVRLFALGQTAINQPVATQIDSLYAIDQQVQTDIIEASKRGAAKPTMDSLYARQFATFNKHIPFIKRIVTQYGYPTIDRVGKQPSTHFFLLVQHADADVAFQEQMPAVLGEEVRKGNIAGSNFAMLTDRVLLARGKPQQYGSQVSYDENGNAVPRNLADSAGCNARRKAYGLPPLADYLKLIGDLHKQMNPGKYPR